MAAHADGFGYTPAQFFELTLPQINAMGEYMTAKAEAIESGSSKSSSAADSRHDSRDTGGSVDSLDQLIVMFGDDASKESLRQRVMEAQRGPV